MYYHGCQLVIYTLNIVKWCQSTVNKLYGWGFQIWIKAESRGGGNSHTWAWLGVPQWWPSFLRFSIRLGSLFSILKPLKQPGSIWLTPHFVDIQSNWPPFPQFPNQLTPLFFNLVRSDWIHFSSLCWASLPKYLPMPHFHESSRSIHESFCCGQLGKMVADSMSEKILLWMTRVLVWVQIQLSYESNTFHCDNTTDSAGLRYK